MKVYNTPNIIPANTVMDANINSSPMQLEWMIGFSIQIVFTGSPTGSFKLQASCDPLSSKGTGFNGDVSYVPTHWTDIADSSQSVTAAGNIEWNMSEVMFNWVRVVYTDGSGGLSIAVITSAVFNGKGV